MSKTVVYIDGQNFMYSVSENLKDAGLISDKQEVSSIDIPYLLKTILHVDALEDTEIRYYGVSKIKKQKDYGEYMLEKSIKFADNLRKLKNCLAKYNVKYIPCGRLRARELEQCKQCGFEDYKFIEKGVDVGLAVDIVRDILKQGVEHVVLVSSDTDLVPAVRVAKDEGVKITYISFDKMIIRPLSVLSNSTITIRGYEVAEAYANSLK